MSLYPNDVSGYEWPSQWHFQKRIDEANRDRDPFFWMSADELEKRGDEDDDRRAQFIDGIVIKHKDRQAGL